MSGQSDEFLFPVGAAGIEDFGDMPVMIRARSDEVAVHGPVVIFAQGKAVGGVVVLALGEWDEVGGVYEADVVAGGEFDTEAAGGALVIVDGEDLATERRRAAVFERLVGDEGDLIDD